MSTSRHLEAGRAATLRAWGTLALYTVSGWVLALSGEALAYYAAGLAVVGMWAAGGEALVASLSTLRHVGEGYARARAQGPAAAAPATTPPGRPA